MSLPSLTLQPLDALGPAGLERTREGELGVDTLNTVGGVDVLDEGDLEAGSRTLTRRNGGVGEEEFPDLMIRSAIVKKSWGGMME